MALSVGATQSDSGNQTSASSASITHSTDANTKCIVVVVTGVDSSATDSVVNSVAWDTAGVNEALTQIAGGRYRVGNDFISIWYKSLPTAGATKNITVTMAGTCTDVQATALNLVDAAALNVIYDSFDTGTGTGSATSTVNPAKSGSIAIGGGVADGGTAGSLSVSTGTESSGSEVDMGSQTASVGYVAESGGTATIVWSYAAVTVSSLAATFYSQFAPTTALNTPADTATGVSVTPTLNFTGTDTNTDEVEYEIQIHTDDVFSESIAYDNDTSSQNTTGTGLTFSHTTSSSANTTGIIVVGIETRNGRSVSSVTYGGDSLTKIIHSQPGADIRTELWYRLLPKSGANDVVVTISASDYKIVTAVTYTYVSGIGNNNTGGVSTDTVATAQMSITGATGQLFVDIIGLQNDNDGLAPNGSQTEIANIRETGIARSAMSSKPGAASTTTDWSWTGNRAWAGCVVGLVPRTSLIDKFSASADATFTAGHPYPSGDATDYTVQAGDILTAGTLYYWRVRSIDPLGSNTYGAWATTRSFTVGGAAVVTGTFVPSVTEADVVTGGKTTIITLTGDTWIAAGAGSFDLQRDEIIAGIDSAQSEATGWDLVPKATQLVTGVVRTSDTVVTITWDAFATYNITANETITITVPGTALTGGNSIVATPTFQITATVTDKIRDILGMGVIPFRR